MTGTVITETGSTFPVTFSLTTVTSFLGCTNVSYEEKKIRGLQMISMEVRGMWKVNIKNQYSIRDSVTRVQCRVVLNLRVLFP